MGNYEEWDVTVPPLPSRSRLYHLEPIGIDTPGVESLTSYMLRLAEAHCISLRDLAISEILPLLTQTGEVGAPALFSYGALLGNAQALNGMSIMATSGVRALEKLTLYKDLQLLTMLPWANVISKYGIFRTSQAWCPLCYEEWHINKETIYNPLLWSLKVVRVCLHHKRILNERCPSLQCQKPIPILHSRSRLGYCPYCNHWLGNVADVDVTPPETIINEKLEQAVWNATAIGELLEVAPCLSSPLQKEDLVLAINSLISRMPVKKAVSLTRLLNRKSVSTVVLWQKGLEIPRMNTLLQICHLQDASLRQIFFREVDGVFLTISEEHKKLNRELDIEPKKIYPDFEETQKALEAILASDEEPFPSIKEVARRLGYRNKSTLYKRFPELTYAIAAKHQKYQNPHPDQKKSSDELQQALETILASEEEPPPSIKEVAQRLGYRGVGPLYSRAPELSRAIATKYRKHNPRQREPMSLEELRQALEAILASDEEPPLSIREVASRLGYRNSSTLRHRCPDLSHAITVRYQKHNLSQREPMSSEELRQALESILLSDEEPPLSLKEVALRLGYLHASPLRSRFPELVHAIVTKRQKYNLNIKKRLSSEELRQALETILASDEESPPSIQEVALRLGYRSADQLRRRFPELTRAIVVQHQKYGFNSKKRLSADALRQALETILASDEEPPPSIQEVALRLGYRSVSALYSRFPELTHTIVAKYQSYNPDKRAVMNSEELRQILESILESKEEPPPSIQEVARSLGYRSETSLYGRFPELTRKIVAKYRAYHSNYKQRMSSGELQEALEAVLASNEDPFPSIQEVAQRLGYHSKGPLYEQFPELAHAIAVRCEDQDSNAKERRRLEELRQALEAVLASNEDPPPSVPEVAQRLGYRSERSLYRRLPELSRAIAERHRKYKFNRQKLMSLEELRQALEAILANDEEPFPSIQEVAQRLGYRHPTFLYKHFPELSRAISMKKRNSEDLQQKLETFLKDADPATTQQEIAKHFGWSINKLHHHFPELRSTLEKRLIQSFDIEALQAALEKELTSDSVPQSLSAVARSLGYPVRTLMRFFPEICQKIIVRGQVYRKAQSELRKQRVQDKVQRAVLTIHAEQKYPSLHQVLKLIDLSCVNPPIFYLEAYIPWKKILEDLGYSK